MKIYQVKSEGFTVIVIFIKYHKYILLDKFKVSILTYKITFSNFEQLVEIVKQSKNKACNNNNNFS